MLSRAEHSDGDKPLGKPTGLRLRVRRLTLRVGDKSSVFGSHRQEIEYEPGPDGAA